MTKLKGTNSVTDEAVDKMIEIFKEGFIEIPFIKCYRQKKGPNSG
jgi:hypothetical protein